MNSSASSPHELLFVPVYQFSDENVQTETHLGLKLFSHIWIFREGSISNLWAKGWQRSPTMMDTLF